jgi:hypothetical protein
VPTDKSAHPIHRLCESPGSANWVFVARFAGVVLTTPFNPSMHFDGERQTKQHGQEAIEAKLLKDQTLDAAQAAGVYSPTR